MFRLGYNTNGFAHHRPVDALRVLADLGYEGVALTPDVGPLDPLAPDLALLDDLRAWSDRLGMQLNVETGARFVLDAKRKHWPVLLADDAEDRARRVDFLVRSVDLAVAVGAPVVSLWSGAALGGLTGDVDESARHDELWRRLIEGLRPVLDHAATQGVTLGFEPEPGMFIERVAGYRRLLDRLGEHGRELGLTLDVGHCVCTGDDPMREIREHSERLVAVQLDDMRAGEHVHLMFGEGELDLPGTLRALTESGFSGLAAVELSRESHRAPDAARAALTQLQRALGVGPKS